MDKWTIRPACTGDFEAVVRMIAELMDYQGLEGETPVEAAVLERDVLQNGHPSVAVAEAAGELVGYVLYFPTYSSRYGRPCRYIEDVYVKAAHRGRGIGGALMRYVIDEAAAQGYTQVLWLDGVERKYVEEGGGMNVMFKINGTVVTPALTGSILRGVTRKSAIELLKSWGVPVEERLLSVDELFDAAASGALEEAWCIGTAAVISPIGELSWGDRDYKVNDNKIGALSQKLYDELTGIQWGTKPDPFGWVCPID